MRKIVKSIVITAVLTVIMWQGSVQAATTETDYTSLAQYLNQIGLFQGTSRGYELDAPASRIQGAVMLVRLLGKEDEALALELGHPFEDVPDWADAYVGYLYQNGISNGVSGTRFGSDLPLMANQYMTFILRVLGYSDANGDFQVAESLDKAVEAGILDEAAAEFYGGQSRFKRNGMVLLSYKGLSGHRVTDGGTLLQQLVESGDVSGDVYMGYKTAPYLVAKKNYMTYTDESLKNAIIAGVMQFKSRIDLDLAGYSYDRDKLTEVFDAASRELQRLPGYSSTLDSYSYSVANNKLGINFSYRITKEQMSAATAAAYEAVQRLITPDMTDYQKELALHDYIVNKSVYKEDPQDEAIYTLYGVMVNGKAVCQGYADTFYYLGTLAGLECDMLFGDADSSGTRIPHAWNVVYIDGRPYQLDVTWDDPQVEGGGNYVRYDYFNLTNDELALDHFWDEGFYGYKCVDTAANYYVANNLVFHANEVDRYLKSQLQIKAKQIMFRVSSDITTGKIQEILNTYGRSLDAVSFSVNTDLDTVWLMNINYQ